MKLKLILAVTILSVGLATTSQASWLSSGIKKVEHVVAKANDQFIEKPVAWVGKQSGVTTTVDNANKAANATTDAAKQATATAAQAKDTLAAVQQQIDQLAPKLDSVVSKVEALSPKAEMALNAFIALMTLGCILLTQKVWKGFFTKPKQQSGGSMSGTPSMA